MPQLSDGDRKPERLRAGWVRQASWLRTAGRLLPRRELRARAPFERSGSPATRIRQMSRSTAAGDVKRSSPASRHAVNTRATSWPRSTLRTDDATTLPLMQPLLSARGATRVRSSAESRSLSLWTVLPCRAVSTSRSRRGADRRRSPLVVSSISTATMRPSPRPMMMTVGSGGGRVPQGQVLVVGRAVN